MNGSILGGLGIAFAASAGLAWAATAHETGDSFRVCNPAPLFARMRAQSGGDRWRQIGVLQAQGSATTSGLAGHARFTEDLRTGRYSRLFDIDVIGRSADVYDGTTLWAQDISGGVHALDAAFPKALAITDAYLARRGYFETKDAPGEARFSCAPERRAHGHLLTIVRVQPPGGIPADLAINPVNGTVVSVTERLPITTLVTRYTDYRRVAGLLLPHAIASHTLLEPTDGYRFSVARYRLSPRANAADFAGPVEIHHAIMRNGSRSTTVPMMIEGHQLMVWVSMNGRAESPFILDTGGHAILTARAARALGLTGKGTGESGGSGPGTVALKYTRVKSIRIGDAEIDDQPMLIIPYPYSFYERGKKTPLAGIIGLEFFERFATRLNYAGRRVTFTPFANFAYHANGTPVPIRFQEDMPMITARADGCLGTFGTDTGNSGALILFGSFLEEHGFTVRYEHGENVIGRGTGGADTGSLQTLGQLTIGAHVLRETRAVFTHMRSGAFASWTEAGNIGYSVLSRFVPTFDYADHVMYLETSANVKPLPMNHTGLSISKNEPGAFDVELVRPHSPASRARIAVHDRIVAVDDHPASVLSGADFVTLAEQPAGTPLRLRIERNGHWRTVKLVLHT